MPDAFEVNPWEVKGLVDYERLVTQFGTQKIDEPLHRKLLSYGKAPAALRRKFWYSHRDLNFALQEFDRKQGFFLYTGRAPSGPMHIGHILPFTLAKWFQDVFGVNLYIEIPDDEKFFAKQGLSLEQIDQWVKDDILDIIAVGFDPNKTFIFQDREFIKQMYTPACRIAKRINGNLAKAVFGFNDGTNIGHLFYPALQIVPCFFEKKRCVIPAAIDQDPYWRIARDLAGGFGFPKPAQIHSKFVVPLTGMEGKMSSSEAHHAILLSDSPAEVKEKVTKHAFSGGRTTLAEHRKLGGNPDVDVAFQWLQAFLEEDDAVVKKLYADYKSGKLLSGEMKQVLIDKLNGFLGRHQKARAQAAKLVDKFKYSGKLAKRMWDFSDMANR
ncbi:tryptophan--tRNA ligase [Candidatus Woesearchaeota archaeon]|nr:tryptophan--tRNA ligase [Candidatus Woesearchaeota archaeon]